MNHLTQQRLGDLLVAAGHLTNEQLEVAVSEQKRRKERLGRILIESGFCTEGDIARCLAKQVGLEIVTISRDMVDVERAGQLDMHTMRKHACIPLVGDDDGILRLAVADPFNVEAENWVQSVLNTPVDLLVATMTEVMEALDVLEEGQWGVDEMLSDFDEERPDHAPMSQQVSTEALVEKLIAGGLRRGATDIHIEPDIKVLRVRYRVDGVLQQGPMINRELTNAIIARIKVMSDLDISETRLPQDGHARIVIDEVPYDLRISILASVVGENVVIRLLDSRTAMLDPRTLGMSERNFEPAMRLTKLPHGIVLVTGPTGSGKSTTLYSLLKTINGLEKKVITVEDPVEYQIPLIRQCQVNNDIGMTFAAALRSILRQDPDVILVGEIRERETAEISIRAALTGHLVFSSLHTNTAVGAVPRLLDMEIDPFLLKSSVAGVLAQRLVRCICDHCKEEYRPTVDEIALFPDELKEQATTLYRGVGCDRCHGAGFSGRIGIHELFLLTEGIKAINFNGVDEDTLRRQAEEDGFRSLFHDGLEKAIAGITTPGEVLRVALSH